MNKKSIGIGIIIGIGAALAIGARDILDLSPEERREYWAAVEERQREKEELQRQRQEAQEKNPTKPSYGKKPGRFVALKREGGFEVETGQGGVEVILLDTATGVVCAKGVGYNGRTIQHCSGTFANYRR